LDTFLQKEKAARAAFLKGGIVLLLLTAVPFIINDYY